MQVQGICAKMCFNDIV